MRLLACIVLWAALLSPAPPPTFTARWDGPGRATVAWSQPPDVHLTCLYVEHVQQPAVLIRCWTWLPAGGYGVRMGSEGPVDAALRPAGGDTYLLVQDEAVTRAPLRSELRLPVVFR